MQESFWQPGIVPLHNGLIIAPKVILHLKPPNDWTEAAACGLCGELIWVNQVILVHQDLRPDVPVLCCQCGRLGMNMLRDVLPDGAWYTQDTPDLRDLQDD